MGRHFQAWEFKVREVEGMKNVQKPEEEESVAKILQKSD